MKPYTKDDELIKKISGFIHVNNKFCLHQASIIGFSSMTLFDHVYDQTFTGALIAAGVSYMGKNLIQKISHKNIPNKRLNEGETIHEAINEMLNYGAIKYTTTGLLAGNISGTLINSLVDYIK